MSQADTYRYKAFISYRHVERDRRWARWLIEALETYRVPRKLVQAGIPQRIGRLFRDDDEIPASGDLSNQIEEALQHSEYLIVICSPDTPSSKWVRSEIRRFQEMGKGHRILVLLVEGEPEDAFLPELRFVEKSPSSSGGSGAVWEEIEPIAADVRPRTDERPKATRHRALLRIAAALLGCRFDDLAQRDRARQLRRQRTIAAVAAACLLGVVAGGTYWWDYTRLKTGYYADFGTRWGVPYGVSPIAAGRQERRSVTYALDSRRGRIVAIRRVDGSGHLQPLEGDGLDGEGWLAGAAEWRYGYRENGRPETVIVNDRKGEMLFKERWEFAPDQSEAVVSFRQAASTGRALALAAGATSLGEMTREPSKRSEISQHRVRFDSKGWVVERRFETAPYGQPARDASGSYGRGYRHSATGQTIAVWNLSQTGERLIERTGVAEVRYVFTDSGDLESAAWHADDDTLGINANKYAKLRFRRDEFGNVTEAAYFGADGRPTLHKNGYARTVWAFDSRGQAVEATFLGLDGRPALQKDGFARIRWVRDERGNPVEVSYFATDGQAIAREGGYVRGTWTYDNRGNAVEQAFFGVDGLLTSTTEGYARRTAAYDRRGNVTEQVFFGPDGELTTHKDGYARVTWAYDERQNVIAVSFYDADGRPSMHPDGYARMTHRYDERGNRTETALSGADGRPAIHRDGYARTTHEFDRRGQLIERAFFDTDGRLTASKGGYARIVWAYDDRGNTIEEAYFGTDGRPLALNRLYARVARVHDQRGNVVEERFFDAEGRPVTASVGGEFAAQITSVYDSRGNVTERTSYTLAAGGELRAARSMSMEYDDRGHQIEARFYDGAGNPRETSEGCVRLTFAFDDRGNGIERNCHAADRRARMATIGYARETWAYDDLGNVTEKAFYDTAGNLAVNAEGFARFAWSYDTRGRKVSEAFFGAENRPVPNADGYARITWTYDDLGRMVKEAYFGTDDRPTLHREGYASVTRRFDARGYEIETAYYGVDDRPAFHPYGFSRVTRRRGQRGEVMEESYFGSNGDRTLHVGGFARVEMDYDSRGNQTKTVYFDAKDDVLLNNLFHEVGFLMGKNRSIIIVVPISKLPASELSLYVGKSHVTFSTRKDILAHVGLPNDSTEAVSRLLATDRVGIVNYLPGKERMPNAVTAVASVHEGYHPRWPAKDRTDPAERSFADSRP